MCGLNLIIDKHSRLTLGPITRMNQVTRHRGPDATAFHMHHHQDTTYFFGHNRLKIIDTSDAANQPFFSDDGRYILLYNGELYNFPELKQQLKKYRIRFRTQSDTEVLLHWLIEKGRAGLEELNGMFTFIFYDTKTNDLLVARDRFGQKPLYFADTPDAFLIASEIKAITATELVKKELNESQLAEYLTFKYARKPNTFFKNIYELAPGSYGTFTNGAWQVQAYTNSFSEEKDSVLASEAILGKTEDLLQASLTRHLQADVPVGLFLSGGIDSTLLLALLAQAGHTHFPSFSIANQASERAFGSDDFYYARLAAKKYSASHTVFDIDDSILLTLPELMAGTDQPIADGASLLTAFLSRHARQGVKVALSGAGADELFGGYNRHRAFYRYLQTRPLLILARPFLQMLVPALPTGQSHSLRKKFRLVRKLGQKIHVDQAKTFCNFTAMDPELRYLLKSKVTTFPIENPAAPASKNTWLRWALYHDLHEYLVSDILALTDQSSMLSSLEVRNPYLDNDLHSFLCSLKPELLFSNGQKWILKELLVRQDGEAFVSRSKEGFGMPVGLWLRNPKNKWLLEPLRNRHHLLFQYLDFQHTQQMLYRHATAKQDFSTEIWALVTLVFWLDHHFPA
ncbi:MAG TPA: asparagine synthase (glutamine-hydrolyzing) [Adhaeribacter sp.]|nr:asparagine synthase (glutamine-hydrolyzing) [Adhaeribacter sp.]